MLEYEKKMLLTPKEYEALLGLFPNSLVTKQINYYYDTDRLDMNRQGITCRVRERDGKYLATIKKHKHCGCEGSMEISKAAVNPFDTSLFADENIKLWGQLTTERRCILSEDGLEVVLDKNTYLEVTDYEIEVEYSPEQAERANMIFRQMMDRVIDSSLVSGLNTIDTRMKNTRNKSQRFFEQLEKINTKKGKKQWH